MFRERLIRPAVVIAGLLLATQAVLGAVPLKLPAEAESAQQPPPPQQREPLKVGGSELSSKLIHRVAPKYPDEAKRAGVQGVVFLKIMVNEQGKVTEVDVVRGHPLLNQAAIDAVSQWVYSPTLVDGQPVPVQATITVHYRIAGQPSPTPAPESGDDPREGHQINLQELHNETQRLEQGGQEFKLVWWFPTEIWRESLRASPILTQAQKEEFYNIVDGYFVLSILDMRKSQLGMVTPKGRDEIAAALHLATREGIQAEPLTESELSPDMKNFLARMKPHMGSFLGELGKGMEIFCFAGKDAQGNRLVDPKEEGSFSVIYDGRTYDWRLPLVSLMPPRFDPETGERFPGNYLYNPFTGKRLADSKDPD